MYTCSICRFATELDDVAIASAHGHCICLRCYDRETGAARPMPKLLQRVVSEALTAAESA